MKPPLGYLVHQFRGGYFYMYPIMVEPVPNWGRFFTDKKEAQGFCNDRNRGVRTFKIPAFRTPTSGMIG